MIKSNIAKGAIISYIAILLNILITFFYTPWMIHEIGVSEYGLYSLIITFISYFIMDFGLNSAVTRFIAKYRAEGDDHKVEQMLGLTTKIYLLIDLIILIVLGGCYFFISQIFGGLTPEEIEKLKVLYVIAGVFSVLTFVLKPLDGALNAYEFFVPNKIIDLLQKIGVVLLVVICLWIGGSVYELVFVNGAVAFICSLMKYFVLVRKSHIKIDFSYYDKEEMLSIFSFSGWTFLRTLAQRFRLSLVPTILGILSNSTEIALFSLGMSLEGMIWNLSSALNGLFLPKVSRMIQNGERDNIMTLMIRVGRLQLFVVFLIFSGFASFGIPFINLWVGKEFSPVYYIVLCLILSYLISNTTHIATDMVYAENKVRYTTRITFVDSLLGLVCAILIASKFGAVGCAICSGAALVLNQIRMFPLYKNTFKLDMNRFFKEVHLKILPLLTLLSVVFFAITILFEINSWLLLISIGSAYVVMYILIVYFFILNHEEKNIIMSLLKR